MAETDNIITKGSQDLKTIEDFVNLPAGSDVRPRLLPSVNVGTLAGTRDAIFRAGGLPAEPFATKAEMQTDGAALADGQLAIVYDETANNGLYEKKVGVWVKAAYDPLTLAKTYINASAMFKPVTLTSATHLDSVTTDGIYVTPLSASTLANNYPFDKKHSTVYVTRQDIVVRQYYISDAGVAERYGVLFGEVWTWQPWQGLAYKAGKIINTDDYALVTQAATYTSVNSMSALNGHLDAAIKTGLYQVTLRSLATTENGFPITGQAGILTVRMPLTTGIVHQIWQSYNGYAIRWGSVVSVGSSPIWQPWQGFRNESGSIIDITASNGGEGIGNIIYGWGSSTLELAASYFTAMAERHNHVYVGHGVSGETLAVSGMQQGSNITNVKFTDAAINNNTAHTVTITHSFKPKTGRSYKEVELSNGVKGQLNFETNTFKPTNLTEPLAVDTTYEYRAINPDFINQGKGLYYFDIGKNNMGYADTAQDIVDAQQEMIDYIPEGSEYLVGGHFVNTGTSGSGYANKVVAVNQILKLRYGLRFCDYYDFLYDDAVWAKYGITKTAEDIAAIAAGELPPSLGRDIGTGTRDLAHLRDEMSAEIALQAEARFTKLGYFS